MTLKRKQVFRYLSQEMDPLLGEPNNPMTWHKAYRIVQPYLDNLVQSGMLSTRLRAVCDSSNNTPETISRHELYVHIADEFHEVYGSVCISPQESTRKVPQRCLCGALLEDCNNC